MDTRLLMKQTYHLTVQKAKDHVSFVLFFREQPCEDLLCTADIFDLT